MDRKFSSNRNQASKCSKLHQPFSSFLSVWQSLYLQLQNQTFQQTTETTKEVKSLNFQLNAKGLKAKVADLSSAEAKSATGFFIDHETSKNSSFRFRCGSSCLPPSPSAWTTRAKAWMSKRRGLPRILLLPQIILGGRVSKHHQYWLHWIHN